MNKVMVKLMGPIQNGIYDITPWLDQHNRDTQLKYQSDSEYPFTWHSVPCIIANAPY